MSAQTVLIVLVAIAAVGLMMVRQLRWRRFDLGSALRLPIVLGAVGVLELATNRSGAPTGTLDIVILLVELVVGIGVGALMGRLTMFRPADGGGMLARTGGVGVALWFVLVAVRIGLDVLVGVLGAHVMVSAGLILILIAATRGTAALVASARAPRPTPVTA